jgi:hypothetical protein
MLRIQREVFFGLDFGYETHKMDKTHQDEIFGNDQT